MVTHQQIGTSIYEQVSLLALGWGGSESVFPSPVQTYYYAGIGLILPYCLDSV